MTVVVDLRVDVPSGQGPDGAVTMAVTVFLPEPARRPDRPTVLFAYPGGGYGRGYFDISWPGRSGYSQARRHCEHGFIVVTADHLGVGDSAQPQDRTGLTYEAVAAVNDAVARTVLERLAAGTLTPDYPAVPDLLALGIGQSLGGCVLTVQQGRHRTFAGVALLGWSGRHSTPPVPAGADPVPDSPLRRGDPLPAPPIDATPSEAAAEVAAAEVVAGLRWIFFGEDVPDEFVAADMDGGYPSRGGHPPMWASTTMPEPIAATCLSAGCVAEEAALIDVPVLVGVGERDLCPDPRLEPTAYPRSTDITVYVLAGSAHMHNFAGHRSRLWDRLEAWADAIGAGRD